MVVAIVLSIDKLVWGFSFLTKTTYWEKKCYDAFSNSRGIFFCNVE
jgi:hypothetical protein